MSILSRLASTSPRTPGPTTPPTNLHFSTTALERGVFDFFRIRMADPIDIMSPAKGWVQQALQLSLVSKAVFHGIAALSSANLAIASVSHAAFTGLTRPEMHNEALIQYSKAIAALHVQIRRVLEDQAPVEPVLLACILLMCFELHAENSSMALRHLLLGRRIAYMHLTARARSLASPVQRSNAPEQLANAFDKLSFGSTLAENESIVETTPDSREQISEVTLHAPSNPLVNAWAQLDRLIDASTQLRRELYRLADREVAASYGNSLDKETRYCLATCTSRVVKAGSTVLTGIRNLLKAHDQWKTAFARHFESPDPQTTRAFQLLQVRHWTSFFTLATCRETHETTTDQFEPDFSRIVDLAQRYLAPWIAPFRPVKPRSMYGNGQDDRFCLEDGILPALYLISLKSRTSSTRHQAVEIMADANRREGIGSSTITAQIAGNIVRIEEGRARALTGSSCGDLGCGQVPEAARLADITRAAGDDLNRPVCRLVCARYLHESGGGVEVVEYLSKGPCYPYTKCAGHCLTGFNFEKSKGEVRYSLPGLMRLGDAG